MHKIYYERNLPHWHPPGATFFLTYRLAGSIPMSVINSMKAENESLKLEAMKSLTGNKLNSRIYEIQQQSFARYDDCLDNCLNEPYWLREVNVAELVKESLHFCGEKHVHIWAYCVMPNHVHVLLRHHETAPALCKILQSHKGFTGCEANKLLDRHGQFWHRETYDHIVRSQDAFFRIARYIMNNPVKARLVKKWEDWPHTYLHPEIWS